MSDFISREAVYDAICKWDYQMMTEVGLDVSTRTNDLLHIIEELPSAATNFRTSAPTAVRI